MLIRPALLSLQFVAVFDSACAMHRGCSEWVKRIRLGALWACVAIAGTVGTAEYPGFPHALFWAQLWLNVAGFIGCSTLILAFAWWPNFKPGDAEFMNVCFFAAYCALQAGCLTYQGTTRAAWILSDEFTSSLRCSLLSLWAFSLYTAGMFRRC